MLEILTQQNALIELQNADWIQLSRDFAQLETAAEKQSFISTLAAHIGGVPALEIEQEIRQVFSTLDIDLLPLKQQEKLFAKLQSIQCNATFKLMAFQQRDFFKTINMNFLFISRTHWNELINRFEEQGREHLSIAFFRINLSAILKMNVLTLDGILSQPCPHRAAKHHLLDDEPIARKRWHHSYIEDHGVNPLIYEKTGENPELEKDLEETGVRLATLFPATPIRGYDVKRTPGGSKVRSVYKATNEQAHHDTLFKHLTPTKTPTENGCISISAVITQAGLHQKLPRLNTQKAVPVVYIATLDPMLARSGMRRMSARTLMGSSATEVFAAHGIEIYPRDKRSQHWSHLIAHFLTGEEQIQSTTPEKELINLVPTTAAANYNTLEAVELFIKNKLMNTETEEIRIKVTPTYIGDNLIPQSLIYQLRWSESEDGIIIGHNERFYINPQSHMRLTKSMHQSIDVVRKQCNRTRFFGLSDTELETDTDSEMHDELIDSPQGRRLDFSSFDSCDSD